MDINVTAILSMFLALLVIVPALSIPLDSQEAQSEHLEEKRPKYMDTRELGDMMQGLVYDALKDLVNKGKVNEEVLATPEGFVEKSEAPSDTNSVEKRRRHLSYCLRRSGPNFVPYPCYKYGGRR